MLRTGLTLDQIAESMEMYATMQKRRKDLVKIERRQSRQSAMERSTYAAVLGNAVRLLEDARILRKSRRYPSATALAILCLEEIGKFRILDKDFAFWNLRVHKHPDAGRKQPYAHKGKQKAAAEALIDGMGHDEVRDLAGVAGYEMIITKIGTDTGNKPSTVEPSTVDILASIDERTFQTKVANTIRRSKHRRFVIDLARGEFDRVKQQSIYVDEQDGELQQPTILIDRLTADRVIRLASGAIYTTKMTLR